MTIKIVTDSACDVPATLAAELDITVVPVYVNVGEQSYLDGVELARYEFYQNLAHYPAPPTTAAPASGTFTETYQRLADEGATPFLSLHIASVISATYNAARLGAEAATVPVTLFDTEQITVGSGLQVIAAAEAVAAGQAMADIVSMLKKRVPRTRIVAMLDTLEFLRRSGRVSWAQFGLGTLLRIKPLLQVHNGEITVAERIRTRKRAVQRLLEIMDELAPLERLAILYTTERHRAESLRKEAGHLFPKEHPPLLIEITPAIGAHVGPGAVGVACIAAADKDVE
jgi:DegV family protein with EDD domain